MSLNQTRRLAILGATGSVGRQSLDVATALGAHVSLLSARTSVLPMEAAIRAYAPAVAVMSDPAAARDLAVRVADTDTRVLGGEDALLSAIAESDADTYVNAILGSDGLLPSLAVLKKGARLALSNKESMVIAGDLLWEEAARTGAQILPVDSEHSAIFQCLLAGRGKEVRRLLLTASGGPFRGYDRARLASVSRADTLAHPTWKMGEKITVDSATLVNKGFEVIEAVRLFGIPAERVEVLVHPESIIHSAVEYIDNTVIAELSVPDMRACVQYAITYPDRLPAVIPPLDLFSLGRLTFERPDTEAFSGLCLAYRALSLGGAAPAILNAADEVAVAAFLREEIGFLAITDLIAEVLDALDPRASGLYEILEKDKEARRLSAALLAKYTKG